MGRRLISIDVSQLTVRYGTTTVLDGLDLAVPAGGALCVAGENGVGKTTLLRCVAGLQRPDGGRVSVFGRTPGAGSAFWRDVATTIDNPSWYAGLTVGEHLDLVRVAHGLDPADGTVDETCAALGLDGVRGALPSTLSSGQRQRLLLAAVLVRPVRATVRADLGRFWVL